jgi:nucleoid-associated protein YgaU
VIFDANTPMLKHPDEIYPGQVLRIPPVEAPTHTVAKGDTLGAIAKHWYGEAKAYTTIYEANTDKLSSPDAVEVGQVLTIPLRSPNVA